jgi:uncharacterized protein (UPF0212 family)
MKYGGRKKCPHCQESFEEKFSVEEFNLEKNICIKMEKFNKSLGSAILPES